MSECEDIYRKQITWPYIEENSCGKKSCDQNPHKKTLEHIEYIHEEAEEIVEREVSTRYLQTELRARTSVALWLGVAPRPFSEYLT